MNTFSQRRLSEDDFDETEPLENALETVREEPSEESALWWVMVIACGIAGLALTLWGGAS